ncbi:MAG: excinuclease ABC subunit UvrC [Promethearchaeati archaeon SRVP18_Atabeyarchaeia-1]
MSVEKIVEGIPESPGVYLMKDDQGHVVYVGKANNIRKRVISHFRSTESVKDLTLSSVTASVEFIVAPTEVEALLLENNLIKKLKPRYNIRLRDDKTYPFIKLSTAEKFPHISIVRRIADDGSIYFGPMGDVGGARTTLKLIRRVFPIRNCTKPIDVRGKKERPCLEYQLKQCSAPCAQLISEDEYQSLVDGIRKILSGELDELMIEFKRRMDESSQKLEFEKAAYYRDRIKDLERTTLKQVMVFSAKISKDVLAVAKEGDDACIQLLMIRGGKLIDQSHYLLEGAGGSSNEEILSEFINQHYQSAAPSSIPQEIMVDRDLEERSLLEKSLTMRKKNIPQDVGAGLVKIVIPRTDEDSKLYEMAKSNANAYLKQSLDQEERRKVRAQQALAELKVRLKLPKVPSRIEVFDVSNIGGEAAVGSMIALVDGEPAKSMYRRYKIRTVRGQDDFAMMKEIVKRRYKRLQEQKEKNVTTMPDLVMVDGGKGQLSAALEAERELGLSIPTIGLAKEFEDVYVPYQPNPVDIPKDAKAMLILKRGRDEAHRFAVSYHRKKMREKTLESILDNVPGIGPKKKILLLQNFDSVEKIRMAEDQELSQVLKVSRETARKLREHILQMRREE